MSMGPTSWWTFSGRGSDRVRVYAWHAARLPGAALPVELLEPLFTAWLASPADLAVLRDVYAALVRPHAADPTCLGAIAEGALVDAVRDAFARGTLEARWQATPWPAAPRQPAGPASPAAPPKTFIAIRLVDPDGVPVPGERYLITLPDGTKRAGRVDGNGFARLDRIDPGTCDVSFPDIDGRRWTRRA